MSDSSDTKDRPARVRRRPPPPKSWLARLPYSIRFGVPLAVIGALLVLIYQALFGWDTRISVLDREGAPVSKGLIEFFVFDDTRASRSPSQKLGEMVFEGAGPHAAGWDLVPGAALIRVTADGLGVASAFVEHGQGVQLCDMGPPTSVRGTVIGADGEAAANARVQAFGSGSHGVLLGETVTSEEGRFELGGLSETLAYVRVRVFAERAAVVEHDVWFDQDNEALITLQRTADVLGRVITPEGVTREGLQVQAFSVPGVEAVTDEEGRFVLRHLPPPPTRTRVVLGLVEPGYTHRVTWVTPGDPKIEIEVAREAIVEGQVVEEMSNVGVSGASVQHDHGPGGGVTVPCDDSGHFRIGGLPPGEVTLRAFALVRVREASGLDPITTRNGKRTLQIQEGEEREAVGILLR